MYTVQQHTYKVTIITLIESDICLKALEFALGSYCQSEDARVHFNRLITKTTHLNSLIIGLGSRKKYQNTIMAKQTYMVHYYRL